MDARRWRKVGVAVTTLALLATGTTAATAGPGDTGSGTPPTTQDEDGGSSSAVFTLVTGDTVEARVDADGRVTPGAVRGPDGEAVLASTVIDGDDVYVLPGGVQALIDAGTVDRELFNVTKLWTSGYDDAHRDTLPVILQYAGGRQARTTTPGVDVTASLGSIGGAGAQVDKAQAAQAWAALVPASSAKARSAGAVEKIWLDEVVHGTAVTDLPDPTVPLTGAGTAHEAGFDGKGVTVAVLDTGFDETHPDLADQVSVSKTFVGGTTHDVNGHGSHTASTVAGSGEASDGAYAGMAPGADLIVGKVLGDDGSGSTSGIIQGMQWAVDQGADIVSMSLGADGAKSCTGPDVDAVQALSKDALFVIAAGNASLRKTVSTPGCAPAALTVGAIDREGETAPFSSRGPSVDGWSAKPDIASQGVDVVAARANGYPTKPYVAYSGTSMATPHVAGAAAILQQAHPDWSPVELKDALTSSVAETAAPVLEQGAGPLDVARAVTQPVIGAPNLRLGSFTYPQADLEAVTKDVTLTNLSDHDVTLDLSVSAIGDGGDPVGSDLFTVDDDPVVVPAHGTADVPVRIDPSAGLTADDYGTITGRLVGVGDDVRVTVPFSIAFQAPYATVHLVTKDRFGNAPDSLSAVQIINRHDGTGNGYSAAGGDLAVNLTHGTYDFAATIITRDTAQGGLARSVTLDYAAHVEIDGDTTVVLDARDADELSWKTPQESQTQGYSLGYTYGLAEDGWVKTGKLTTIPSTVEHLYATPTTVDDRFTFEATTRAFAPEHTLTADDGYALDPIPMFLGAELDAQGAAPVVDVGPGTDANLAATDVRGKILLVDASTANAGGNPLGWDRALKGRGAQAVLAYVPGTVGRFQSSGNGTTVPMFTITAQDAEHLQALLADGGGTVAWDGTGLSTSPYAYNLGIVQEGKIVTGEHKVKNKDLAKVSADYHAQGYDARKWISDLGLSMPGAGSVYASASFIPVAPQSRTEYFSASPDVRWTSIMRASTNLQGTASFDGPRSYEPGAKESTSWFDTPYGATLRTDGVDLANRDIDRMTLSVPHFGDAAGHDSLGQYGDGTLKNVSVGDTRLVPTGGAYELPSEPTRVTVEQGFDRRETTNQSFGLSFRTTWGFTTSTAVEGPQPLLVPTVDVPIGLDSRLPAGEPVKIALGAVSDAHNGPVDLDSVRLEYAYGTETQVTKVASWTTASMKHNAGKGTWTATVPNDGEAGQYVNLRVVMEDSDGNTVTQSMARTYQLGAEYAFSVSARSQCVNGDAAVAVYAYNTGTLPADVTLASPWGSTVVEDVAPGKAAYTLFDTGLDAVWAGEADVTASGTVGTLAVTTPFAKDYAAVTCG
ncbi:subtilase family protein [Sediminihabitans luteus]|uniref:Subtilase family protein n=1 Tax=Sediminihabitans luteus TaxID=1138585 RepID=A0A2M9CZH8_9CELL|nr:S8 family serine peptidase [Sediminihabitans luteus]PJJ77341.1 subtilase family protein [Sediminihabitans luteus]GII98792.1 peptidase [Sediminihabitans luteus]